MASFFIASEMVGLQIILDLLPGKRRFILMYFPLESHRNIISVLLCEAGSGLLFWVPRSVVSRGERGGEIWGREAEDVWVADVSGFLP